MNACITTNNALISDGSSRRNRNKHILKKLTRMCKAFVEEYNVGNKGR